MGSKEAPRPLEDVLALIESDLKELKARASKGADDDDPTRHPGTSRWVGQHATEDFARRVAAGELVPAERRTETLAHEGHKIGGGLAGVMTKALAKSTASAGGVLVPIEIAHEVVMLLRARSAVMSLGPTIVQVEKELDVTSLSTGATAQYVAENAAIPTSEQTFSAVALLRPKTLAALVPVSLRLLRDAESNPAIEEVVRRDLAEIMALRADLAFISGPGGAGPTGITQTAGTTDGPDLVNLG